ncbi:MAG TPA: hypothetical protein DCM05_04090 [Elusimicrobia bacterium]|nr:hypothetical protein [Elusimicrobiota bacterium]
MTFIGFVFRVLLWSTAANFALLLLWALLFIFAGDLMFKLHSRWFKLSRETFDAIHYSGMAFYKLLILFFNAMPLLALWLAAH